jgi:hypothetical protein
MSASSTPDVTKVRWTITRHLTSGLINWPVADLHETSQQGDGGDRDYRGDQFQLESGKIYCAHPGGAIDLTAYVQFGNKILVTREDHDKKQVAGQR